MDRLKIGFEYFKLGFLYIFLLIIRLFCFVSIKDIDTGWFRKKMHEVPIFLGTILMMVLIFIDKEYLIVLYITVMNQDEKDKITSIIKRIGIIN